MTTTVDIIAASPYLSRVARMIFKGASTGVHTEGSFESPTAPSPDGVDRAFATNDVVDDGSRMPEPGVINSGIGKVAAAGIAVPKPPSVKPPKAPTATAPKPETFLDGRTDKPAGMNLVQGLETVNNGSLANSSATAFSRRIQGSPA
jgi:hypothetical protein